MLDIRIDENNEILLSGRFDASQTEKAGSFFNEIRETYSVNFKELDYISSAGLSVLLATQKRLAENGQELILKNMNNHIRDIFRYAGFDLIFKIED